MASSSFFQLEKHYRREYQQLTRLKCHQALTDGLLPRLLCRVCAANRETARAHRKYAKQTNASSRSSSRLSRRRRWPCAKATRGAIAAHASRFAHTEARSGHSEQHECDEREQHRLQQSEAYFQVVSDNSLDCHARHAIVVVVLARPQTPTTTSSSQNLLAAVEELSLIRDSPLAPVSERSVDSSSSNFQSKKEKRFFAQLFLDQFPNFCFLKDYIKSSELTSHGWSKPSLKLSPNVKKLITLSIKFIYWFASLVKLLF